MIFDQGDPNNPRGHALVYFTVSTEPEKVYSSYIVILPLKSDLSKYNLSSRVKFIFRVSYN